MKVKLIKFADGWNKEGERRRTVSDDSRVLALATGWMEALSNGRGDSQGGGKIGVGQVESGAGMQIRSSLEKAEPEIRIRESNVKGI